MDFLATEVFSFDSFDEEFFVILDDDSLDGESLDNDSELLFWSLLEFSGETSYWLFLYDTLNDLGRKWFRHRPRENMIH